MPHDNDWRTVRDSDHCGVSTDDGVKRSYLDSLTLSPSSMADKFPVLQRLLSENAQWSKEVEKADPGFFERSAENPQTPDVKCAYALTHVPH